MKNKNNSGYRKGWNNGIVLGSYKYDRLFEGVEKEVGLLNVDKDGWDVLINGVKELREGNNKSNKLINDKFELVKENKRLKKENKKLKKENGRLRKELNGSVDVEMRDKN